MALANKESQDLTGQLSVLQDERDLHEHYFATPVFQSSLFTPVHINNRSANKTGGVGS
jgi:hypothetical protein